MIKAPSTPSCRPAVIVPTLWRMAARSASPPGPRQASRGAAAVLRGGGAAAPRGCRPPAAGLSRSSCHPFARLQNTLQCFIHTHLHRRCVGDPARRPEQRAGLVQCCLSHVCELSMCTLHQNGATTTTWLTAHPAAVVQLPRTHGRVCALLKLHKHKPHPGDFGGVAGAARRGDGERSHRPPSPAPRPSAPCSLSAKPPTSSSRRPGGSLPVASSASSITSSLAACVAHGTVVMQLICR